MTSALALTPLFAAPRDSESWRAIRADAIVDPAVVETERTLVEKVCAGDGDAFCELMKTHFPHAARFAASMLHDREAGDDIAQEVFANIWASRRIWKPPVSVRAYVLGAVRRRALNVLRHERVVAEHAESIPAVYADRVEATASAEVEHSAEVTALRQAIATLPERRRMALALRYEHEMSHAEVGAALGVSAKAAKELIMRTLDVLYIQLRTLR